ncbi:MAG: four-helix bundle copper-binding protein [Alphaproteobacteria bacterium]|nr:four-helix bundle copper-binding protein [Alphaproteobacteria bacterium]
MRNAVHDCIELCWKARTECQKALYTHCVFLGGKHTAPEHVKVLTDCMEICQTAADFMTRQSSLHAEACAAAVAICEACADSCEELGTDHMLVCADACRKCAKACDEICSIELSMQEYVMNDPAVTQHNVRTN